MAGDSLRGAERAGWSTNYLCKNDKNELTKLPLSHKLIEKIYQLSSQFNSGGALILQF